MGDGPFYVFYTPYHLPHVQLPSSIARAVLFHDATTKPIGKPMCDVLTAAKRDLRAGEVLDGVGGFTAYGIIENSDITRRNNFLPMGLSQDCRLKRNVRKDELMTYADVELPSNRLIDNLRLEQDAYFK